MKKDNRTLQQRKSRGRRKTETVAQTKQKHLDRLAKKARLELSAAKKLIKQHEALKANEEASKKESQEAKQEANLEEVQEVVEV